MKLKENNGVNAIQKNMKDDRSTSVKRKKELPVKLPLKPV